MAEQLFQDKVSGPVAANSAAGITDEEGEA